MVALKNAKEIRTELIDCTEQRLWKYGSRSNVKFSAKHVLKEHTNHLLCSFDIPFALKITNRHTDSEVDPLGHPVIH